MYPTIGSIFDQTVSKYPNKEALVEVNSGKRWTYKEWQLEVHRLANALTAAGVRKGDRVSTFLFNTSELAMTLFACAKIGAVFNPINYRLKPKEMEYILQDASPKIVIFEKAVENIVETIQQTFPRIQFWSASDQIPPYAKSYYEKLQFSSDEAPLVEVSENDLYAIMYTSGTTGRPKGVLHRHREMVEQSLICASVLKLSHQDIGLVGAPMFHCAELHCSFLPRVLTGASSIIVHQFNAKEVLQTIEKELITTLFAAPTMWNLLLQEQLSLYNLNSLRIGLYGAAPMAPVLVLSIKEKLGISLVQAYGQTEMGPAVSFLLEDEQIEKAGSVGRPCFYHDIRIVRPNDHGPSEPDDLSAVGEIGEIIVKGPCMMQGYYQRKEATEKALYKGWYHTSDLGYYDEDGFLYIADRVDDMIISGGENVYPREVEDILYEHEGVLDVAIVGIPNEVWGEQVIAVVVKKNPQLTETDLEEFCKKSEKLANYKRPRQYYFVEQLPRNASGKIQKYMIKDQLK